MTPKRLKTHFTDLWNKINDSPAPLAPDGAVPQCARYAVAAISWGLRLAFLGFPLRTF
ncbi:MAG: hypothetical protein WCA38_01685 [Candidatus Acidiferrales bacterium]